MANTLNLGNGNWATKEDSLLAYNSENGNFKPLPFDFTRASSATVVNKAGLIETVGSGEPRIDFKDDANGALLLEPQRSNLVAYSEAFNETYWSKSRVTVTQNNVVSPDGTLNADKLIETSDTGLHAISSNTTVTSGVSHTFSVFIKKGSSNLIQFLFGTNNVTGNPYVNFDVNNGLLQNNGVDSANIENYGNGWYRCSATYVTATTAFTNFISPIQSISDSRVSSFTGNVNNNIYIYGAMIEQGSYATSYIPTSGSAVTRVADACNNTGNDQVFNDSEGVIYFQLSYSDTNDAGYLQISDGTSDNRIIIWNLTSTSLRGLVVVGGAAQAQINGGIISSNTTFKVALKYKTNDFALWVDGVKVGADVSGLTFGSNVLNKIDLSVNTVEFKGNVKDVRVYNTALTDAELTALTKI